MDKKACLVRIAFAGGYAGCCFGESERTGVDPGKWTIDAENITENSTFGYDVTFDQNRLKAGRDIIPQVVDIGNNLVDSLGNLVVLVPSVEQPDLMSLLPEHIGDGAADVARSADE